MLTVVFDGSITLEILEQFKNIGLIKKRLPISNPTFHTNVKIVTTGKGAETSSKNEGFFLKDAEIPNRALHVRVGSMTLHLLNKYEPLNMLIKELEEYWQELTKIAKDIVVKDISVRYLNLITKTGAEPIDHYVTIYPKHPFNNAEVDAFTNIRFTMEEASIVLTITEGALGAEKGIILDYTINKMIEANNGNCFNTFHELRELKNKVFFKSITPNTVKIYQS